MASWTIHEGTGSGYFITDGTRVHDALMAYPIHACTTFDEAAAHLKKLLLPHAPAKPQEPWAPQPPQRRAPHPMGVSSARANDCDQDEGA